MNCFNNADSTAEASATAGRCSESRALLQKLGVPELGCGQGGHQEYSLPESDPGYAPIPNQVAESLHIYSRSTLSRNFEIGSRKPANSTVMRVLGQFESGAASLAFKKWRNAATTGLCELSQNR
jgi:hypothetical protein